MSKRVQVNYHVEPDGVWADSPQLPGWTAAGESVDEVRALVEESVPITLEELAAERVVGPVDADQVKIEHR